MVLVTPSHSRRQNPTTRVKINRTRPLSNMYLNKLRGLISSRWERTWSVVKDRTGN